MIAMVNANKNKIVCDDTFSNHNPKIRALLDHISVTLAVKFIKIIENNNKHPSSNKETKYKDNFNV
jgi:hypothetical protein